MQARPLVLSLERAAASQGIAPESETFNAIAAATPGLESSARIEGSDNDMGWNIGLLRDLDANSRIGAQCRSRISYRLARS